MLIINQIDLQSIMSTDLQCIMSVDLQCLMSTVPINFQFISLPKVKVLFYTMSVGCSVSVQVLKVLSAH